MIGKIKLVLATKRLITIFIINFKKMVLAGKILQDKGMHVGYYLLQIYYITWYTDRTWWPWLRNGMRLFLED